MKINFYTPVVTAFDQDGEIDIQGNKNIFDHLIQAGIDGILVLGSSGEFYSLTAEQKKTMVDLATSYLKGKAKVFIGTGSCNVEEAIFQSNYAFEAGADGIMVIGPYYFALDDAAIEKYFDEIAENVNGPIYIYNYPQRTGYDVKPEIVLRLLRKHKNIVGMKDSVSEMGHSRKVLTTVREEFPNFKLFSGFDENLMHNYNCGGAGCIGALSNIYPEVCIAWRDAVNAKDWDEAARYQKKIDSLMDIYDINPLFISVVKKAMVLRKVQMDDTCRQPILKCSDTELAELKRVMHRVEAIEALETSPINH